MSDKDKKTLMISITVGESQSSFPLSDGRIVIEVFQSGVKGYITDQRGVSHDRGGDVAPGQPATNSDTPESDTPESDTPESDASESDAPESDASESDASESDAPESDAPEEKPAGKNLVKEIKKFDDLSEWLHQLGKMNNTDTVLAAAFYVQCGNKENNTFASLEVTNMLKDSGRSFDSMSGLIGNLLHKRYVFKVKKRWRVSHEGEEFLCSILSGDATSIKPNRRRSAKTSSRKNESDAP